MLSFNLSVFGTYDETLILVVDRAVSKWLSKVITWLRLLRLVIGLKESRQYFNQWEAKPKPIASCTRDFSRASSKLQVISRNSDWFMALFASVVIGRSSYFGFGFTTVIWKPLYITSNTFEIAVDVNLPIFHELPPSLSNLSTHAIKTVTV